MTTTNANENRYVGLNEGMDMWEINYDEKTAQYIGERTTYEDLKVNNMEHLYEEYSDSIEDWLEEHGFKVTEGADESENVVRRFE